MYSDSTADLSILESRGNKRNNIASFSILWLDGCGSKKVPKMGALLNGNKDENLRSKVSASLAGTNRFRAFSLHKVS